MVDIANKTRTFALAALAFFAAAAALADTPLVQALKVQQKIAEVVEALRERGVQNPSFERAPEDIRQISFINDFLDGQYVGPIVYGGKSFSNTGFKNLNGIFDVYMPNLTAINDEIFRNAVGMRSFRGPDVTSVNQLAFEGSRNLSLVDLPECTYIGAYAFQNCSSLTNANIPKVTSTGAHAFENCSSLRDVNCQPLATAGDYAFSGCTSLTNVPIRKSSATFNMFCFYNCQNLDVRPDEWPDVISLNCGRQFYNCRSLKDINPFLSRFTSLASSRDISNCGYMFYGCAGLTDVRSDNIAILDHGSLFQNCTSVTNVSFPNLLQIGQASACDNGYMFAGMTSLKRVDMPKLQSVDVANTIGIIHNLFQGCTSLEEIEFPELEYIGYQSYYDAYRGVQNMFRGCSKLRSAGFPKLRRLQTANGVTSESSGNGMFSECYELTDVQMPALEVYVQCGISGSQCGSLFRDCASLREVSLPSLRKTEGWCGRMYYNCAALRKVSMPKLVDFNASNGASGTKNMSNVFYLCPGLTDVTFGLRGAALKAYAGFPAGAPTTCVFHCPADAPYNVDVVYMTNAWTVVTNGTFRLVESISGTGTQYVNTGYTHGTNTEVEIDFALTPRESTTRTYEAVFGSRNGSDTSRSFELFSRYGSVNRFAYARNQVQYGAAVDQSAEVRYRAVCCTNSCSVFGANGELLYSFTAAAQPDSGVGPMLLFCRNNATTAGGMAVESALIVQNMKLFRFTVRESGETVMDLVPALVGGENMEQTACLVDTKNGFHPLFNCGAGSFEHGAVTNDVATAYGP